MSVYQKSIIARSFILYWSEGEHPEEYTRPYNPEYNWQWESYFEFLGVEIK